jgi:hypothetical protein
MNEATESAGTITRVFCVMTRVTDLIRNDIKELRNKYGTVTGTTQCDLCHYSGECRLFEG